MNFPNVFIKIIFIKGFYIKYSNTFASHCIPIYVFLSIMPMFITAYIASKF